MKGEKIQEIISQKNWDFLIANYSIKQICSTLNFHEAMCLSNTIFYENMQDDTIQQFALDLAFDICIYIMADLIKGILEKKYIRIDYPKKLPESPYWSYKRDEEKVA